MMRVVDSLITELRHHEGYVSYLYDDATGLPEPIRSGYRVIGTPTIGFGTNITTISREEAELLLRIRALEAVEDARTIFAGIWDRIGYARQTALANMAYNLGHVRLRGFRKMREALFALDFERAAEEALSSRWAQQVGRRAEYIAHRLRVGDATRIA